MKALECPLCGEDLDEYRESRYPYWSHGDDDCMLAGIIVHKDNLASWNTRALPAGGGGEYRIVDCEDMMISGFKTICDDEGPIAYAGAHDAQRIVVALAQQGGGWRSMDSAPKSTSEDVEGGKLVLGKYMLGYIPEIAKDPEGCMVVIWWEPNLNRGCWCSDAGENLKPTHWMPLPAPPQTEERK